MTTWIALGFFVAIILGFNLYLRQREQARTETGRQELEELRAMGDVIPASIHPEIDPIRCIGSGACVYACPEKRVLTVVNGRGVLTNPLGCIGHGACASACPVQAISLVFGTDKRGLELPQVDPDFQTNQPGIYIVGELGGMGLIRNAVTQGRQAADHIVSGDRRGTGECLDALVVGAGPAGTSATLRLMEAGLRVLLLEREAFGGTITHYPRAKVVMTGSLDFPVYGRVSKRKMSKEQLVTLWKDIQEKTRLQVAVGELVEKIERGPGDSWLVSSTGGVFKTANVLLALGRRGSPRKLEVPGEERSKVAYRVIEPEVFRDQHVLVVGGGNAAVESAFALLDGGNCASVTISYRKNAFARCREPNRKRIEAEVRARRLTALMGTQVEEIFEDRVTLRNGCGGPTSIQNDAVVVQVGGTAPTDLLQNVGIEIVTKYGEA
ncbi:MAG: NAD(P)-binding domain-containing protein [Polyangiales bacterium]|jgi:thioredoxin reductase/NAD-dependent dihydropyrimidine dehydrogenase PreA subunit